MDPIEEAESAVVVEIFRSFPNAFVWIGGSVLRIVNHSPRTSFDIDLLPSAQCPAPGDVQAAIARALDAVNAALGASYRCEDAETGSGGFLRFPVTERGQTAFSVDVTRIAGSVRRTVLSPVTAVNGAAAVPIPSPSVLLHQKARALLARRYPKAGDLFDVWFLLQKRTALEEPERAALSDEFSHDDIDEHMQQLRKPGIAKALARSGVSGLTAEAAGLMVDRVQSFLEEAIS